MNFDTLKIEFDRLFDRFVHEYYGGPELLNEAIRYALLAPGKRARPMLSALAARAVGGDHTSAWVPSLAVGMLHTYSLVHDDLPCMDNDSFRRGRPTVR